MKMKKIFVTLMGLMLVFAVQAQPFMRGSIQPNVGGINRVDVLFKATYTSAPGEHIQYVQFSLAIPAAVSAGVTASLTGVGNFAALTFNQDPPYTYGPTGERVFTWVCLNPGIVTAMSWNTTEFIGATVTFAGNPAASAQVKVADYTNYGGGGNSNTYFAVVSSTGDLTDYAGFFYSNAGVSTLGTYGNADQFVRTDGNITLPVGLLSFSGYKDGSRNQLRWSTSTEQNNMGFEVQRSIDGVNYSSIGFVNSLANGGNSSVTLNYAFTDNSVTGSRQFYRLRQADLNGGSKLSNIVLIKGDKPAVITIDALFPNPATTVVNLMLSSPVRDKVQMTVTDMSGRTVMQRQMNVETGTNNLPINVSALAGGTYMIRLIDSNGEATTGKFVKQ
jgi:hypothetical protein